MPSDDKVLSAETLAQVASALGLPGLQFSWIGEPQAAADGGSQGSAPKEPGTAAATAEPDASDTAAGSETARGEAADEAPKESPDGGGVAKPAVAPASDADGASKAAGSQQQAAEPDSSKHSEL